MSISTVVTRGFGSGATIAFVTTRGYSIGVVVPVVPTPEPTGGGTSKRDRKRKKVIRFSDFESQEAREEVLQAAVADMPVRPYVEEEEDEDDEILLKVLMVVLH